MSRPTDKKTTKKTTKRNVEKASRKPGSKSASSRSAAKPKQNLGTKKLNSRGDVSSPDKPLMVQFDDNAALTLLFGDHDRNLSRIENELDVAINARGNAVAITGAYSRKQAARDALMVLYDRIKKGGNPDQGEVDAVVRLAAVDQLQLPGTTKGGGSGGSGLGTQRRHIIARTPTQAAYIEAMNTHELVLGLGPAGTGKTYLAVCAAVSMFSQGLVDRIVLSRPAVEAGERLGFLPGDLREKVDPYLRPLYDALNDAMSAEQVAKRLESGEIEIAPLAFMRGRTLSNAYVILDEAQNTTPMQMKMFLTRLGENSRMVVTGDLSQIDLPGGVGSGLRDAVNTLKDVDGAAFVHFSDKDVVRPPLVARIIRAYDTADARKKKPDGSE